MPFDVKKLKIRNQLLLVMDGCDVFDLRLFYFAYVKKE